MLRLLALLLCFSACPPSSPKLTRRPLVFMPVGGVVVVVVATLVRLPLLALLSNTSAARKKEKKLDAPSHVGCRSGPLRCPCKNHPGALQLASMFAGCEIMGAASATPTSTEREWRFGEQDNALHPLCDANSPSPMCFFAPPPPFRCLHLFIPR